MSITFSLNQISFVIIAFITVYISIISLFFPIIPGIIYQFTLLDVVQSRFSIGDITPAVYIGGLLIFVGLLNIRRAINDDNTRFILKFCLLILIFPFWLFIRYLLEGSDLRTIITFIGNIFVIISYLLIINNYQKLKIIYVTFGIILTLLSISIIAVYYFPDLQYTLGIIEQEGIKRMMGLSRDPNYGGTLVTVGFIFALSNLFYSLEAKKNKLLIITIIQLLIIIYSLLLTISRGAILSASICLILMYFLGNIKLKNYYGYIFLVAALLIIINSNSQLIDNVIYRYSILTYDESNAERLRIFQSGLNILKTNWLWGLGETIGFHNTYIDVAIYGGFVGLFSFMGTIISVIVYNYKGLRSNNIEFKNHARFIVFGMISVVINGLFIGVEFEKILWLLIAYGFANLNIFREKA